MKYRIEVEANCRLYKHAYCWIWGIGERLEGHYDREGNWSGFGQISDPNLWKECKAQVLLEQMQEMP